MTNTHSNATRQFSTGLICGLAVGAALGLLFAPTDGKHLRHQLGDGAKRLGRQSRQTYDGARRVLGEAMTAGRNAFRGAHPGEHSTHG